MDLSLLPGGRRLDWEHLSAPVREALQARLGSPVMHAATQPGGFSPGLAARLRLADGRRVFIKAAGLHPNPDTPALLRAEAQITAALPASAPSPRLLWSYDDQGWVALAFEDIQGKLPTLPWQPGELQRVLEVVAELAVTLTPAPVATRLGAAFSGWRRQPSTATTTWPGWTLGPAGTWTGWSPWSRPGRRPPPAARCCTLTCGPTTCCSPRPG